MERRGSVEYLFGDFRLGPSAPCLRRVDKTRTAAEIPINLNNRELTLLRLLVERKGQVVFYDDIFAEVWHLPPRCMDNTNIHMLVFHLRRALDLGEDGIQNVRTRGYRIALDVTEREVAPEKGKAKPTNSWMHLGKLIKTAVTEGFGALTQRWTGDSGPEECIPKVKATPLSRWDPLKMWRTPHKMWSPRELAYGLRRRVLVKTNDGVRFSEGLIDGICEYAETFSPRLPNRPPFCDGCEISCLVSVGMAHILSRKAEIVDEDLLKFIASAILKVILYLFGIGEEIGIILIDGDNWEVDKDYIKGVVDEIHAEWYQVEDPVEVLPFVLSIYAYMVELYIESKQPSHSRFKYIIAILLFSLSDGYKLVDFWVDWLRQHRR